ncbi:MAG TPA: putative lipopolysaccharide heptosyltransferase III [Nitrospira sp.]|nr:putative lipopolysaccharide heptosyltransferase III [Nitrospira sp.]
MNNILVIKLRYVGDVLLATPTLQALKTAYPAARLTMLVNRGTEEVLLGNPHLDQIMVLDKGSVAAQWRLVSQLRAQHFDLVIDLTDGDRSAFLSWISGAPVRIGFNDEGRLRGRCYTAVVHGEPAGHRIERDLAALKPLGIGAGDRTPRLWLAAEDEARAGELLDRLGVRKDQQIVVIQPGARYWFKAWPADRYAELADRLAIEYHCLVVIGGTVQEGDLARRIIQSAKSRPLNLAGLATLKQFAAIVKRAMLFVGNDSGAMHIAAAVGTPVVALFGPSNPREWGPCGGAVEVIYKEVDCRACFHPTCQRGEQNCMKLITLDEVMAASVRLMGRPSTTIS